MTLPTGDKARKALPVFRGPLMYFPDAFAELARVCQIGNDQHNLGEQMHWARGKSMEQMDTALRHMMDHGTGAIRDTDGAYHMAKAAWRCLAELQLQIERDRAAAPAHEQLELQLDAKPPTAPLKVGDRVRVARLMPYNPVHFRGCTGTIIRDRADGFHVNLDDGCSVAFQAEQLELLELPLDAPSAPAPRVVRVGDVVRACGKEGTVMEVGTKRVHTVQWQRASSTGSELPRHVRGPYEFSELEVISPVPAVPAPAMRRFKAGDRVKILDCRLAKYKGSTGVLQRDEADDPMYPMRVQLQNGSIVWCASVEVIS